MAALSGRLGLLDAVAREIRGKPRVARRPALVLAQALCATDAGRAAAMQSLDVLRALRDFVEEADATVDADDVDMAFAAFAQLTANKTMSSVGRGPRTRSLRPAMMKPRGGNWRAVRK